MSKLAFLLFLIEESSSYQKMLTQSKNIGPSLSYHIFKIGNTSYNNILSQFGGEVA